METTIAQLPAAGEQEREAIDPAATISPNLPPEEASKSSAQLPHFLRRENISREECCDLKKFEDGMGEAIINREVHSNMLPAFLLANWLFIWAKDFFLKILDAPVESVDSFSGTEWPIFCQEWILSTHAEDNIRTALKLFNGRVRIFPTTESGLYGRARLPLDTEELTFEMDLSSRFFDFFSSEFSKASSSTKNAVSICMAATIVHEMAHIFWYIRCHLELGQAEAVPDTPGRSRLYRPEPKIDSCDMFHRDKGELGRALEKFMFGGVLESPEDGFHKSMHEYKSVRVVRGESQYDFFVGVDEIAALLDADVRARVTALTTEEMTEAKKAHPVYDGFTDLFHRLDIVMGVDSSGRELIARLGTMEWFTTYFGPPPELGSKEDIDVEGSE